MEQEGTISLAWLCTWYGAVVRPDVPRTFSDYASLLEVAFAFNALYSLWASAERSYGKPSERTLVIIDAFETAKTRYERHTRWLRETMDRAVPTGRVVGFLVALSVGLALTFVHPDTGVSPIFLWWCWSPPLLMVTLEIVARVWDWRVQGSIQKRYAGALDEETSKGKSIARGAPDNSP